MQNGDIDDIPANVAPLNEDGINDAIGAYVTNEGRARTLADRLERNPRPVIKRALRLNNAQRAGLAEHTDDELERVCNPVVEGLRGPNALNLRVRYTERFETESPLRCRGEIELET